MRLLSLTALLLSTSHLISSASIAQSSTSDLIAREPSIELLAPETLLDSSPLIKRKGGGGGKSGGSGGSSGSSGGGSRGASGGVSSSGRTYSYSSISNVGGRTRSGSGPAPAYGGYYAGGARVPYAAGGRSPSRGFVPFLLPITALAFFPGIWLYGSLYAYPFGNPYYYRNATNQNVTVDVTCLCQQYSVCGCDDNGNNTYVQQLITNGSDTPVNSSEVVILPLLANGTQKAYVNGTLPNGTTASGGTDPSSDDEVPVSAAMKIVINYGGYWLMLMTVWGAVMVL